MPWRDVRVVSIKEETPTAKTFRFALNEPVPHRAGQHYVVRLTAPGGYTAERSYSIASPPPDGSAEFELTVEPSAAVRYRRSFTTSRNQATSSRSSAQSGAGSSGTP